MAELPDCCKPRQYYSPSGLAWFHARECSVGRGQKIRNVRAFDADAERRRRAAQAAETARTGVVIQMAPRRDRGLHPACIAARDDEGQPCAQCSWRMGLDNEGARWFQAKLDERGY